MSHFASIGLSVESEEGMQNMIERAGPSCRSIEAEGGRYELYSEVCGTELWMQVNAKNEIIGVNPHFNGSTRRKVSLLSALQNGDHPLDGAFYAWANPTDPDNFESGDYPFVFDVPDMRTHINPVLPQIADIQLSAFAHDIAVYSDKAAFEARKPEEPNLAAESFIPSGLFIPEDAPEDTPPQPYCIFAGTVVSAARHTSDLSGASFHALHVSTLGGDVDVVIASELLSECPYAGNIVQGSFWLSGRIVSQLECAPAKRKGLFGLGRKS